MNEKKSPWIIETSDETFEADVFERSKETPVVVDFWATWCQPCRLLAPLLEKLAEEHEGRFVLVKADTDHTPKAAGQFEVQSIPAVYGVVGGEVVDFFQGVLPEDQLQGWLDNLLLVGTFQDAKRLEETDPSASEEKYRTLTEKFPNDSAPAIGLARVLLAQGREDDTRAEIGKLEKRGFLEPEAEKIKATLELGDMQEVDLSAVRAEAEASPDDLEKQLHLAEALAADKQYEEALQIGLTVVEKDRGDFREKSRQMMVDVFRVLPDDSELTGEYRRKLSSALY